MNSINNGTLVGHYTSLSTACEHILPNREIRFSPIKKTNDPRENKKRIFMAHYTGIPEGIGPFTSIGNDTSDAFLNHSKVFCGTLNSDNNQHGFLTKCCFGRPRMWAQYGDAHRGVCLVFDRDELTDAIEKAVQAEKVYNDKVVYNDNLNSVGGAELGVDCDSFNPSDTESGIASHIHKYRKDLFFMKDSDWAAEDEYRWVIIRPDNDYIYVPFGSALKSIYLGVDCPKVYHCMIKNLAGCVSVNYLYWNHGRNNFECTEI